MDQQTIMYLGATSLVAVLVILNGGAFGGLGFTSFILAILTIMLLLMINYADFLLFPALTRVLGVKIIPAKGYYIPNKSDCIIKYVNGIYYATGYLTANIYNYVFNAESIDEAEELRLGEAPDKWERVVMNAGFPFRFNVISIAQDVQTYREELEGARGALEFRLGKEEQSSSPSQMAMDDLHRKMSVIDSRIARLSSGERPVDAIMYIETTAVGVSEKEAVDLLASQLSHLQTLFNAFDLSITRVVGREIYNLFGFNYMLPEKETLVTVFNTQG